MSDSVLVLVNISSIISCKIKFSLVIVLCCFLRFEGACAHGSKKTNSVHRGLARILG